MTTQPTNLNAQNAGKTTPVEARQAEALFAFLSGEISASDASVPQAEAALATELRQMAQGSRADPQFEARLRSSLMAEAARKHSRRRLVTIGQIALWAGLAIFLLFGLRWVIQNALPGQPVMGSGQELTGTPTEKMDCVNEQYFVQAGDTLAEIAQRYNTPLEEIMRANQIADPDQLLVGQLLIIRNCLPAGATATATTEKASATPAATSTPAPTPTPVQEFYHSEARPDDVFVLQSVFPETPVDMQVYKQIPWEALTVDGARQAAAQMSVPGGVYQPPASDGNDNAISYIVTNGFTFMTFRNDVNHFFFENDRSAIYNNQSVVMSVEEQVARAKAFLEQHNMLNFSYKVEAANRPAGSVNFLYLLDGYSVRQDSMWSTQQLTVNLNAQGQVTLVQGSRLNFQPLGRYPIISAAEAWQAVLQRREYGMTESEWGLPVVLEKSWQRTYPMEKSVDVYGLVEILKPADGSSETLFFLSNILLKGNLQGLENVGATQFLKVTGQFLPGEAGQRMFQVEHWQISPLPYGGLQGTIHRQDGKAYLVTQDKGPFELPDLPDDVPADGKLLWATGVAIGGNPQIMEWNWLGPGGGGGGGGGGPEFYNLDLQATPGANATWTPMPALAPVPQAQVDSKWRKAIVDQVELAYYTPDLSYALPDDPALQSPYAQPVWRFTGRYEDGSFFEFIVQALQSAYLTTPHQ